MNRMKRTVSLAAAALGVAFVAGACTGDEPGSPESSKPVTSEKWAAGEYRDDSRLPTCDAISAKTRQAFKVEPRTAAAGACDFVGQNPASTRAIRIMRTRAEPSVPARGPSTSATRNADNHLADRCREARRPDEIGFAKGLGDNAVLCRWFDLPAGKREVRLAFRVKNLVYFVTVSAREEDPHDLGATDQFPPLALVESTAIAAAGDLLTALGVEPLEPAPDGSPGAADDAVLKARPVCPTVAAAAARLLPGLRPTTTTPFDSPYAAGCEWWNGETARLDARVEVLPSNRYTRDDGSVLAFKVFTATDGGTLQQVGFPIDVRIRYDEKTKIVLACYENVLITVRYRPEKDGWPGDPADKPVAAMARALATALV